MAECLAVALCTTPFFISSPTAWLIVVAAIFEPTEFLRHDHGQSSPAHIFFSIKKERYSRVVSCCEAIPRSYRICEYSVCLAWIRSPRLAITLEARYKSVDASADCSSPVDGWFTDMTDLVARGQSTDSEVCISFCFPSLICLSCTACVCRTEQLQIKFRHSCKMFFFSGIKRDMQKIAGCYS